LPNCCRFLWCYIWLFMLFLKIFTWFTHYQLYIYEVFSKCSLLLSQNVAPATLLRFLRDHRSEWADSSIDAYSASSVKATPCILPGSRIAGFGGQVILPLAHTLEHEEVRSLSLLLNVIIGCFTHLVVHLEYFYDLFVPAYFYFF